jgi:hypothetical protein
VRDEAVVDEGLAVGALKAVPVAALAEEIDLVRDPEDVVDVGDVNRLVDRRNDADVFSIRPIGKSASDMLRTARARSDRLKASTARFRGAAVFGAWGTGHWVTTKRDCALAVRRLVKFAWCKAAVQRGALDLNRSAKSARGC